MSFAERSAAELTGLWNRNFSPRWQIEESSVKSSIIESHLLITDGSEVWEDGFAVLKSSGTPTLFPGQDPLRGHVSALVFSDPARAVQSLTETVIPAARRAGLERLAFGMDPDHFWPGCPVELPEIRSVLENAGFEMKGGCFDLERDLLGYEPPPGCLEVLQAGANVRACRPEDRGALDEFLAREFPSRWRHDVMRKAGEEPGQIYLLWENGQVEGFAMTQREGCVRPISGATWRRSLGPRWGALGPIGVSKAVRGRGLGDALLGSALLALSQSGARNTIIDWTTLDKFYGAHGFEVTRRYSTMIAEL